MLAEGRQQKMTAQQGSAPQSRRINSFQEHRAQEPLDARLAEILARNLLTADADPALRALRAAAGTQTALLARFCGEAAGFFMSPATSTLCTAIIEKIEGAARWAEVGRERRLRATSQLAPRLEDEESQSRSA